MEEGNVFTVECVILSTGGGGIEGCDIEGVSARPHEMATATVGMHPTGIHSCWILWLLYGDINHVALTKCIF